MEAKIEFCVCYNLQKRSNYHLGTLQTTLSENDNYFKEHFFKILWGCHEPYNQVKNK